MIDNKFLNRSTIHIDIKNSKLIKAHTSNVFRVENETGLRVDKNNYVRTVEHLMSALKSLFIDNLLIEINSSDFGLRGFGLENEIKLRKETTRVYEEIIAITNISSSNKSIKFYSKQISKFFKLGKRL